MNNPYEDNLRRLIREHIKDRRLSLSRVAEEMGTSFPVLSGFMDGSSSPRDSTIEKIETYIARVQPNGERSDSMLTTNGHAAQTVTRRNGPPELRGFILQTPEVAINGAFGVNLRFDESSGQVRLKLLVAVRRFLGVETGSRFYVYLSADARQIALAVAPNDDAGRSARMGGDGVIAVTWLRQSLLAAGWTNGMIPATPLPDVRTAITIACNGCAA